MQTPPTAQQRIKCSVILYDIYTTTRVRKYIKYIHTHTETDNNIIKGILTVTLL